MAKTTEEAPLKTFERFVDLSPELRLKIWEQAIHHPRTLALWSDFQRCEVENTIFYTQLYESKLTPIRCTPPFLRVSKEASAVAQKQYVVEFETNQAMVIRAGKRPMLVSHPGFYVNFSCDTLCPRGTWNIISMEDFVVRTRPQLRFLAMDISTEFYRALYKDYIERKGWPFEVMEEVTLYDGRGMEIFKKGYAGGKVHLDFIDIEMASPDLLEAREKLDKIVAAIEEKAKAEAETKRSGDWIKKPRIKIKQLLSTPLTAYGGSSDGGS